MANSQDQAPRPIVAVIPGRLAASVSSEDVLAIQRQDWWQTAQEVASDWQAVSAYADFWEFGAPAIGYGRAHELAACSPAVASNSRWRWPPSLRRSCGEHSARPTRSMIPNKARGAARRTRWATGQWPN